MSNTERQTVSVKDLVEEAKKRIVFLAVSVVGLSYLMSLTSPSVLVNLPAALFLIIILRYLSLDFDMRRKAATYKGKPTSTNSSSKIKPFEHMRVTAERSDWKQKVNSPTVEDAIDQFTRHIVSEWVTDLWYSRITPDRQGPEELVLIMNGVLGEISSRMRSVNLIDLLTRDVINLVCRQLELFRSTKTKIEKRQSRFLTIEERDIELKSVLAAENKLHPALFSAEAEHKVLQHVMDGLISLTFHPADLQCSLFRYISRELLACVVMRPVLNLANPRFINERIENLVNSGSKATHSTSQSKIQGPSKISSDNIALSPDPSIKGVELVQLKKDQNNKDAEVPASDNMNATPLSKDPLLSMDARSTRSWSYLQETYNSEGRGIERHHSGGEWGDMLDVFSRRKTEALAPEHFDNMWAKGRDYRRQEDTYQLAPPDKRNSLVRNSVEKSKVLSGRKKNELNTRGSSLEKDVSNSGFDKCPVADNISLYEEDDEHKRMDSDEVESGSSSYNEDEDTSIVTGLDSPGVKVWDGKSKRNLSHVHHPLETFDGHKSRKINKGRLHAKRLHSTKSASKRSRSSNHNGHVWKEVQRTSFLLGDGHDILNSSRGNAKLGDSSEDSETDLLGSTCSGATTSSSLSLTSLPETHILAANSAKSSLIAYSFFKLKCEVLGANIVMSGSKTFAVYSLSVTDVNGNSWSIKRRFRHFEELHRRLKVFAEYNLHLPPKHFLSTGLDLFVIQERCKLLDQYLKKLLQLPTVSCSIEVWDFLSVDSQMYTFSNSLSIIETLPVVLEDTKREKSKEYRDSVGPLYDPLSPKNDSVSRIKGDSVSDGSMLKMEVQAPSPLKRPEKEFRRALGDSSSDSENPELKNIVPTRNLERTVNRDQRASHSVRINDPASDPTLPSEWVPPNVSIPLLDLVDVILQLKDGGWIRRKAFWVAKQVLQLGMGDALDDWLIEKIQLLRQGSVVASCIRRLEQILWPDGIFITKHPARQKPPSSLSDDSPGDQPPSTPYSSSKIDDVQELEDMQQKEAKHRAKLVYEIMIDKAPAAIVGLVGRKEYEQCAKDLFYFIQSSVCMKQLAFNLLQLLLLSAFPELEHVFRQLEEEKEKFGKLELN
ncbi:Intermediate filament-like protein [Handroanthus impetiginosus]|uniref:Intermediate filament-like protein n=1 Tax=Handroanthus impetiginosus TaxID=429701 RepID=A0A2G9G0Z5_9LAMI|nr:Intermediate filament-like protein [Handroanthus impetiginosus]